MLQAVVARNTPQRSSTKSLRSLEAQSNQRLQQRIESMERSPSWEGTFLGPRSVRNSRSDFAPAIPATTSWRIESKESSNLYQHQRLEAFETRRDMLFTDARQTSFAEAGRSLVGWPVSYLSQSQGGVSGWPL